MERTTRTRMQALIWAAIIIAAALIGSAAELSSGASVGIITGLSGAAWASLQSGGSCCVRALQ
ncbi:hypothetical protein [Erythrobacter sp. MTPC3]|uniref:hypothetical protein n=1 Tax=Erythrobacter sp. MTPC3 TaxID=3056564 RepID=UPI0036F21D21